jgi:asparagine synthetase B (glutamine-hydrolysing)
MEVWTSWLLNRMDKNVMQASVEARVPFLEAEVVKLVLNLPLEVRFGPWTKGIHQGTSRLGSWRAGVAGFCGLP